MSKTVFFLMGPTASGKTDLAIRLAEHLPIEIINVDATLVYKGLDIGSGKPDLSVREKIPHHLIDICEPDQPYSVGQFRADALRIIDAILANNKIPLLVGGTMMYYKTLVNGLGSPEFSDINLREELNAEALLKGWPSLHARLENIDPVAANRIKPTDAQRISRALEVYYLTNKTLTKWLLDHRPAPFAYPLCAMGFIPTQDQRKILHMRIERRFLEMLDQGFIEEVERLKAFDRALPAMRSVGYKQILQMLDNKLTFNEMKDQSIAATRQLAKRQITWLRRWPDLREMDFFHEDSLARCMESMGSAEYTPHT